MVKDPFQLDIDQHLRADGAGEIGTVEGGATDTETVQGGLDDRILFGMQATAEFMPFAGGDTLLLAQTANFKAMTDLGRSAIVAGGDNALVAHEDGPHLTAQAGGTLRDHLGDAHEVLIP